MVKESETGDEQPVVKAWDVGVRVFHWLLVILVVNAWVTAELAGMEMYWHKLNGYGIFFILVFRFFWGFWGSDTARFGGFFYGPRKIMAYVRGILTRKPLKYLGHNPLGALMVFLMLAVLITQVGSGLFSSDGLFAYGPLSGFVSEAASENFALIHELGFYLIMAVVFLHVSVILVYLFILRENLIKPMFTGKKSYQNYLDAPKEIKLSVPRMLLCVMMSLVIVLFAASDFDLREVSSLWPS